jgi:hypothetical protein
MTDHELLARVDDWNSHHARGLTADLIHELAAALRAALATQPQPLFEGTVEQAWNDGGGIIALPEPLVSPERLDGQRVVVYPAVAGSATPRVDALADLIKRVGPASSADAVAGSATPTGDDDD